MRQPAEADEEQTVRDDQILLLPFRMVDEEVGRPETRDQKMGEAHPYLSACMKDYGFDWLLDNVPLILRPW